jgi:hypothetical protein
MGNVYDSSLPEEYYEKEISGLKFDLFVAWELLEKARQYLQANNETDMAQEIREYLGGKKSVS